MTADNNELRRYIVVKAKNTPEGDDAIRSLSEYGNPEMVSRELGLPMDAVTLSPAALEEVQALPHVLAVYPDEELSIPEPSMAEEEPSNLNPLTLHRAPEMHQLGFRGKGVRVAVLDTGIDRQHAETTFAGRIVGLQNFTDDPNAYDEQSGHGTWCAGAVGSPQYGGAPECELLIGKVLNNAGSGYSSRIIRAIEWAVVNGARVISMSLGGNGNPDDPMCLAVDAAFQKGAIVPCAAGNSGCATYTADTHHPGCARHATCVAAVGLDGTIAGFSSCGNSVDIAAAGVRLPGLGLNGTTGRALSGTSMATPQIAWAAALLFSTGAWDALTVRKVLYSGARDTGLEAIREGYGILDVMSSYGRLAGEYYPGVERVSVTEYRAGEWTRPVVVQFRRKDVAYSEPKP